MKKQVLCLALLLNATYCFPQQLKERFFETELFEEDDCYQEQPTLIIATTPKKFSVLQIPFYVKLTALGLYESKIKPFYYAVAAYIKSIFLKIKRR